MIVKTTTDVVYANIIFRFVTNVVVNLVLPRNMNSNENYQATNMAVTFNEHLNSNGIFLQTAQALLTDDLKTENQKVGILMDDGSQKSFIVESPISRRKRMVINGFGEIDDTVQELKVVTPIIWNLKTTEHRKVELYVIPTICSPIIGQKIRFVEENYDH